MSSNPCITGWILLNGRLGLCTWLRTIKQDLRPLNIGLVSAWQRAQHRERWKRLRTGWSMLLVMIIGLRMAVWLQAKVREGWLCPTPAVCDAQRRCSCAMLLPFI